MKEYDVHFIFSGYVRQEAGSPEEATKSVERWLARIAGHLETDWGLHVVDDSYTTDVLEVAR